MTDKSPLVIGISQPRKRYWQPRELVVIGVFSALIKLSSLLIAIAGGGMNPVTLGLKNLVATMLLVVLIAKVRKPGTLLLFVVISSIVSALLNSVQLFLLPGAIIAALTGEVVLYLVRKHHELASILMSIAIFDFVSRLISLTLSYLMFRESMGLFVMAAIIIAIGYIGCVLGLGSGILFTKELKHAGIIRH